MTACALRLQGIEKGTTTMRNPKRSWDCPLGSNPFYLQVLWLVYTFSWGSEYFSECAWMYMRIGASMQDTSSYISRYIKTFKSLSIFKAQFKVSIQDESKYSVLVRCLMKILTEPRLFFMRTRSRTQSSAGGRSRTGIVGRQCQVARVLRAQMAWAQWV